MAICKYCKQEMLTAEDCTANREVEYPDGKSLLAISYDPECDGEDHHCHDCGIKLGGYHHPGCDMEECPRCHGQLISCGCLDEEDYESDNIF